MNYWKSCSMKKTILSFILLFIFYGFCHAQELHDNDFIDIEYFDSLCPGFEYRYNTIQACKYSNNAIEETIALLEGTISSIEAQNGLFDDINYFEAIRLVCAKCLIIGDYRCVDSILFATKKFLFENFENPFDFNGIYKYNRAASWIEINEGRFDSAKNLLEEILIHESDSLEFLSAIQDLTLCYLQLQQYDDFIRTAKASISVADAMSLDANNEFFKITSKKLEAYLSVIADNDLEKGIAILENLADDLKGKEAYTRLRCSILDDLCYCYISSNQTDKYIQIKNEILDNSILSKEEKIVVLESLVGVEWLNASDKDIIEHAIMHSDLVKALAVDNLIKYSPTQNIPKWSQLMEKIDKDSYILNRFPNSKEVCGLCYDNELLLKNDLFSSDYAIRKYVNKEGDACQKRLLHEIDSLREHIVYMAANEEYSESYSYDLAFLETDLMKKLPMSKIVDGGITTWEDVSSSLKSDEIAIEITDCNVLYPQDSVYSQLMALVVTHNCSSPKCIKLGNYYEIAEDLKKLFSGDAYSINQVYSTANNTIYRLLWGKLEKQLLGKKNIYISSNTLLSFVNIGALLSVDGKRMSDKLNIRILSSTARIVSETKNIQYSNATLFGGSDFGEKEILVGNSYSEIIRAINSRGEFKELHGAIEEVNEIKNEFEKANKTALAFSGKNANENNFRSLNGKASQIIHIATHCFNIRDMENHRFLSNLTAIDSREGAMIGTGFILSKANQTWDSCLLNDPKEDGILLSEDISRLNLEDCDLLVLAGCQSGEGKMDKDGIYGLQRAFKRAGVNTLLLSLWNVDDNVAKEFMVCFYRYLLQTNNKYTAYYQAQNEIRNKYSDPYYWASFIMLD